MNDVDEMVNKLISKGLTNQEAMGLLEFKIKNDINMISCGADAILNY